MNFFDNKMEWNSLVKVVFFLLCSSLVTVAYCQSYDSIQNNLQPNYNYVKSSLQFYPISTVINKSDRSRSIMLPSINPTETSYPLFCRLEDKINAGNKIQCLFRLGSLSYVNYLEQKGDHQRLMLEQIK